MKNDFEKTFESGETVPAQPVDPSWAAFGDYLTAPYKNNQRQAESLRRWHSALSARNDLDLKAVRISNGKFDFDAYVINDQVIFSRDKNVLAVPYARGGQTDPGQIHSDQFVGVWLRDFGDDPAFLGRCEKIAHRIRKIDCDNIESSVAHGNPHTSPYLQQIVGEIQTIGVAPDATAAAQVADSKIVLRFHGLDKDEHYVQLHRDNGLSREDQPYLWTRTILHPLVGDGTLYALDGNDPAEIDSPIPVEIALPPGVTYSHCSFVEAQNPGPASLIQNFSKWGIRHAATRDKDGRAAFIKLMDNNFLRPVTNEPSPWKIERVSPPPGVESVIDGARLPSLDPYA